MAIRLFLFFLVIQISASSAKAQSLADLKSKMEIPLQKIPEEKRKDIQFVKASSYFFKESYDSALVRAFNYLHQPNADARLKAYCRYFRGYCLIQKKLYNEALVEFNKIPKNFPFYPSVNFQVGNVALIQGKYQKALDAYKKLDSRTDLADFAINQASLFHNMGLCYLHLEEYAPSEKYLLRALEIEEKNGEKGPLVGAYMDLANLYYNQYRDNEAIPFFEKAYTLSKEASSYEMRQNAALNMSVVAENKGDLEAAVRYRKEYDQWKDSLNDQSKVWEIGQLEKRVLAEQKQKEIQVLETENKAKAAQQNALLVVMSLLVLLVFTFAIFYHQKVKRNRIIAKQKEELDTLNTMKNRLFSIVSHDLRSSVNAIRVNTEQLTQNRETYSSEELNSLLEQNGAIANSTYGLLDNVLNWAMLQTDQIYFLPDKLRLSSVIDQVAFNYKPLFSQKEITFENHVPTSLRITADLDSFKIVLRNILDNAIKFSSNSGFVRIRAEEMEDMIALFISDSGRGISQESLLELQTNSSIVSKKNKSDELGSGLGVSLCKSMVEKNHGTYEIFSTLGEGTTVKITFPKAV